MDQYIKGQLLENARAKLELSIHPVFNTLTQIINTRVGYLDAFTKMVEADSSITFDEHKTIYDKYLDNILQKKQADNSGHFYLAHAGIIEYSYPDDKFGLIGNNVLDVFISPAYIAHPPTWDEDSNLITLGTIQDQEYSHLLITSPIPGISQEQEHNRILCKY